MDSNLKILVIGDPHFNIKNRQRCLEFSNKFIQMAKKINIKNKLDLIICLGDIFHTHEKAHMLECKDVIDFLNNCQKICKTILLIGNHDRLNNSVYCTNEHFLYMYNVAKEMLNKNYDRLIIVDKPQIYKIKGYKLGLLPYVSPGRFNEALQNINTENINYLFCHQEFNGCKMGNIESRSGDIPSNGYVIFSGHIHDKQILKYKDSVVIYTGTPFQQRYGEDPDKTICLLTINTKKYYYEELDVGLPKLLTDELTIDEFNEFNNFQQYHRLIINGKELELNLLKKSKKFKQLKKKGIKFSFKLIRSENIEIKENIKFIDKFLEIISENKEAINLFNELHEN